MQSTHKCEMDWPMLPLSERKAHIIPKLAQQSLLSVVKLCAAGCRVILNTILHGPLSGQNSNVWKNMTYHRVMVSDPQSAKGYKTQQFHQNRTTQN